MPDVTQCKFQQSRVPDQNSPTENYLGQNIQSSQKSSLILIVVKISKDYLVRTIWVKIKVHPNSPTIHRPVWIRSDFCPNSP